MHKLEPLEYSARALKRIEKVDPILAKEGIDSYNGLCYVSQSFSRSILYRKSSRYVKSLRRYATTFYGLENLKE